MSNIELPLTDKNKINRLYWPKAKTIVVGNSPSLLDYEYGEQIDSFTKVIRCNYCHTDGFEKHVGSKTNIWVTSINEKKTLKRDRGVLEQFNEHLTIKGKEGDKPKRYFLPNKLSDKIVWFRSKESKESYLSIIEQKYGSLRDLDILSERRKGIPRTSHYGSIKESIRLTNPWPLNDKGWVATTGLVSIMKALTIYDKITIAGFTFYTENSEKRNTSYNGLNWSENLRQFAQNHVDVMSHYVNDGRISFLIPKEEELFNKIKDGEIK